MSDARATAILPDNLLGEKYKALIVKDEITIEEIEEITTTLAIFCEQEKEKKKYNTKDIEWYKKQLEISNDTNNYLRIIVLEKSKKIEVQIEMVKELNKKANLLKKKVEQSQPTHIIIFMILMITCTFVSLTMFYNSLFSSNPILSAHVSFIAILGSFGLFVVSIYALKNWKDWLIGESSKGRIK